MSTPTPAAKASGWVAEDSLKLILAVNGANRPTGIEWQTIADGLGTGKTGEACRQQFNKLLRNAGYGVSKDTPTKPPPNTSDTTSKAAKPTTKAPKATPTTNTTAGKKRKATTPAADSAASSDEASPSKAAKSTKKESKSKASRAKKPKKEVKVEEDSDMSNGEGKGIRDGGKEEEGGSGEE